MQIPWFLQELSLRAAAYIFKETLTATKQETSKCNKENIQFLTIHCRLYYFMVLWRMHATSEEANAIVFYNDLRVEGCKYRCFYRDSSHEGSKYRCFYNDLGAEGCKYRCFYNVLKGEGCRNQCFCNDLRIEGCKYRCFYNDLKVEGAKTVVFAMF